MGSLRRGGQKSQRMGITLCLADGPHHPVGVGDSIVVVAPRGEPELLQLILGEVYLVLII